MVVIDTNVVSELMRPHPTRRAAVAEPQRPTGLDGPVAITNTRRYGLICCWISNLPPDSFVIGQD